MQSYNSLNLIVDSRFRLHKRYMHYVFLFLVGLQVSFVKLITAEFECFSVIAHLPDQTNCVFA